MRKICLLSGITIFILLSISTFAYDNLIAHPGITEAAIKLYENKAGFALGNDQKNWIINGSIEEDTFPRYLNHFYDPTTGSGLSGQYSGAPAKEWAKSQPSMSGDYSINAILSNYQDKNYKAAYEGIGHILHLIQDMSVPAHTRNDPHPDGDPYEKWVEQNGKVNIQKVDYIDVDNIDNAFDGLAKFTNANFLSKDTAIVLQDNKVEDTNINGLLIKYSLKNIENRKFKYCIIDDSGVNDRCIINDDFYLNLDYWNMLYPKATGYSAGIINYFVEKFNEIDNNRKEEKTFSFSNLFNSLNNYLKYNFGQPLLAKVDDIYNLYLESKELKNELTQQINFVKEGSVEEIEQISKAINDVNGKVLASTEKKDETKKENKPSTVSPNSKTKNQANTIENKKEDAENELQNQIKPIINYISPDSAAQIKKSIEVINKFFPSSNPNNPPETFFTSVPPALSSSTKAYFNILSNDNNANFEVNLNSGGWEVSSQTLELNISEGQNCLLARAKNNNLVDLTPVEYCWQVDFTPPTINWQNAPSAFSSSTNVIFEVNSNENATYLYILDNNPLISFFSSTTISNLAEGDHIFSIYARDDAGNISSSSFNWLLDQTVPTSTINDLNTQYEETGFLVSWQGNDNLSSASSGIAGFDLQYSFDYSNWTNWLESVSDTQANFTPDISDGQTVYLRIRCRDSAGNISEWSKAKSALVKRTMANHIVISQIQISGQTADDEFVVLYNPTSSAVSLDDYKLKRKTSSTTEYNIVSDFGSAEISPYSYFLITHPTGYTGDQFADIVFSSSSYHLTADNTIILYKENEIIDLVGYGNAPEFTGNPFSQNPANNESVIRKAIASSTFTTMVSGGDHEWRGNGYDTENNNNDFVLAANQIPNNSSSPIEPRNQLPVIPDKIDDLLVNYNYTTNSSIRISWNAPQNGNISAGSKYDVRYRIKTGANCNINTNWLSSTETDGLPDVKNENEGQNMVVSSLNQGTTYCLAIRTYNGEQWSKLSNVIIASTTQSQTSLTQLQKDWRGYIITQTLTPDKNPYYINRSTVVAAGNVLTIQPGVVIKFGPWFNDSGFITPILFTTLGQIRAEGTDNNPIIFTSYYDDTYCGDSNNDGDTLPPNQGYWGGIFFNSSNNIIDHAIIKYGGADNRGAIVFWNNDNNILSNSKIYNNKYGLDVNSWNSVNPSQILYNEFYDFSMGGAIGVHNQANPVIKHNSFHDTPGAIGISGNTSPIINYNNFDNISGYSVLTDQWYSNPNNVDARYNWWSDASGPTHASNPGGQGVAVSDKIDFSDWAGERY